MKNLNVVLALIAGLIGGIFSQYIFSPVQAQSATPLAVAAQSFVLVDANGKTVGVFTSEGVLTAETQSGAVRQLTELPAIVLYNAKGSKIWRAADGAQNLR